MSASAPLATPTTSTFPIDDRLASPAGMFGDNDEEDPTFESTEDEASYYRERYRVAVDLLNETRAELDDFQTSSRELEQELEKELEATEAKQQELKDRIRRLEAEKEEWRTKSVQQQKQHSSTVSAMQREMDNLRTERDKTLVALRDLEMGNDELERNERVAVSSLLDMEIKYNRAIEEKTLLEQEIIVKQEVEEDNQRLKDECRDANNEISILRDQLARATVPTPPASNSPMSPKPDAELPRSRATSAASRTASDSPAPSDRSTATQRSEKSTTIARRSLQSPNITPRARTTASPRVARTSIPALSPATKRSTSSPSGSAIPAMSRSTATRNLAGSTATPAAAKRLGYQPSPGTARAVSNINNGTTNQTAKTKGFRLLHDLQARIRATDDRLNTRVSRRDVTVPGSTIGRRFPTSATSANLNRAPAAHSRITQLSKSTTVTTLAGDKAQDGLFSPTNWVLVSDSEDTPVAKDHRAPRRSDPASPLERTTFGQDRKSARSLPQRPGIPSPLAPALSRSVRAPAPPAALSQSSRYASSTAASRAGLGVSTSRPPSRSQQRMDSSTMRPPSRTHKRAESASTRPPSRSHTRTLSRPESRSDSRTSRTTGASSPEFGERNGVSPELAFLASRPSSRSTSRATSRPDYDDEFDYIEEREPMRRPTLSSSILGKSQKLTASTTGTYKRVPRRSSLGPAEASLPPSAIPAPKTTPSRPTSYPVFQNTPPPPVPRIPSMHARARQGG